ncbi:hypothetical protein Q1695_007218 [Nippostrongylus brasiliensis]|nr:hypothetical protein Q1695_007218 [Nippostrongylus brasiliensis]
MKTSNRPVATPVGQHSQDNELAAKPRNRQVSLLQLHAKSPEIGGDMSQPSPRTQNSRGFAGGQTKKRRSSSDLPHKASADRTKKGSAGPPKRGSGSLQPKGGSNHPRKSSDHPRKNDLLNKKNSQKSPSQNKPVKPPVQAVPPNPVPTQVASLVRLAKVKFSTESPVLTITKTSPSQYDLGDESVTVEGVVYVKKRRIGKGCSGSVFEVVRQDNNIAYALKEASLKRHEDIYREEVDRLLVLKSCQRIVKLIAHEIYPDDQTIRMILELGEGDLEHELKKKKTFVPRTVRRYAGEIAKAIQEMHVHSIIHLDIKLANVLLVKGRLKIIDLGLSATIPSNQDYIIRDFMFGSNRPPEQIVAQSDGTYKLTKKVDIWGLGIMVYQMAHGRKPFPTAGINIIKAILDSNFRIHFNSETDPALKEFIEMCTQRDVEKRASIEQLLSHRYLTEITTAEETEEQEKTAKHTEKTAK